jgi:hypothetical protein
VRGVALNLIARNSRASAVVSGSSARAISQEQEAWFDEVPRQISSIGPIHAALLIVLIQAPHHFRTKPLLWVYSGPALKTYTSGNIALLLANQNVPKSPWPFADGPSTTITI